MIFNVSEAANLAIHAMTYLANHPEEFDPRKYLGEARKELIRVIRHKNETVLGSAGRA